ncbi:DUF262 domain-containing protein [Sulfurovum mangrovi]|uniref:DUF262 domain-containing protein n=1 Tax=Sulfurovum mangrovi TaxID=2893889 RepID=UPI001E57567F|nr:DUF262 domain-containing protein [Sulfurovum mangrovi]UFH58507.1 DUF262 domain-containing protein [Sulfurovum mangrovi]
MESKSNLYLNKDQFENIFKKHIKTSVYSLSIKSLFSDRMLRKIKYDPYYQRNYVWDSEKASFFIESILLGTDIPPMIFFNNGSTYEVIDGRQRFETIKKFKTDDLKLSLKGLTKLPQLKNQNFSKLDNDIQEIFDDAKIRIFEFEIINEPKLESILEDKIKKEIFRRYNSGITPLNNAEIDNATYDDDSITIKLKELLSKDHELVTEIGKKFLNRNEIDFQNKSADILQFLRKYLILSSFPINTYATGNSRSELIDLLYNVTSGNVDDTQELCNTLISNLKTTLKLINLFKNESWKTNKQLNLTLLWAINILLEEQINIDNLLTQEIFKQFEKYIEKNYDVFEAKNSHYYKEIITRHRTIADFFENLYDISFKIYFKDDNFKDNIKEMRQSEKDAKLKLAELSSLRVQKPEPSLVPVYEIIDDLSGKRYLIRPSYQRHEKINTTKASAIIESIILGINLPPIFIFKNKNGVKEVIDGQQRLLSILGFTGKKYRNENDQLTFPKNNNYKLKGLRILKELNKKSFYDLDISIQDKILDFKLSIIEIDYNLNTNFDPVDLFIRLNNKPYPIKENSFEMWNSFIDNDIIERIKVLTNDNIEWFFIKQRSNRTSDRMENEELITLLVYIYYTQHYLHSNSLGFYGRDSKVNCRIREKKAVSTLLEKISTDVLLKRNFLKSIEEIEKRIEYLKTILNSNDLKKSLNEILGKDSNNRKRYFVDFYILFQILQRYNERSLTQITFEKLKEKMLFILSELKNPSTEENDYQTYFEELFEKIKF